MRWVAPLSEWTTVRLFRKLLGRIRAIRVPWDRLVENIFCFARRSVLSFCLYMTLGLARSFLIILFCLIFTDWLGFSRGGSR